MRTRATQYPSPAVKLSVIYYLEYRLSVLDLSQRTPRIRRAD